MALTNHRIAHALIQLEVPLIPRIISEMAHSRTGIDIHPGAVINEKVFIDFEEMQGDAQINVYNLQGQIVLTKSVYLTGVVRHKLDFSDQPSGIYVVQINQGSLSIRKKIIKK